jgi:hypothetical protein
MLPRCEGGIRRGRTCCNPTNQRVWCGPCIVGIEYCYEDLAIYSAELASAAQAILEYLVFEPILEEV